MNINDYKDSKIIVIIATSNQRNEMLLNRSLKSVYDQEKINPKQIFIVDDNVVEEGENYSREFFKLKKQVNQFRINYFINKFNVPADELPKSFFRTMVIHNYRTKHNSGTGAWNTAAIRAFTFRQKGKYHFLAFLDDDDEWDKQYLSTCWNEVEKFQRKERNKRSKRDKKRLAGVVTDILRMEENAITEIKLHKKHFTKPRLFYIGNPGWQGSNIFIELKLFFEIGGFDENMKSCTDRDLAIRLIDYLKDSKKLELKFTNKPLVKHYVHGGNRVSTNFTAKQQGLNQFYLKYLHRMLPYEQKKSFRRAKELFNYDYVKDNNKIISPLARKAVNNSTNKFNLVIGITSNNDKNLKEQLNEFCYQLSNYGAILRDYRIVILENTDDEFRIRPIINYFKETKKLKIEFVSIEQQRQDFDNFKFKDLFNKDSIKNKSIAFSRSYLHNYVANVGRRLFKENFVSWIIDDDAIPNLFIENSEGEITTERYDYLQKIAEIRKEGKHKIVLGTVTDAPPLPFISSIRTQMIDLFYNLDVFSKLNPEDVYLTNLYHNIENKKANRDFYYDLSRDSYSHLETPFWWTVIDNKKENLKVCKAFSKFLDDACRLQYETNVFRPITITQDEWHLQKPFSNIFRGGNTIIFDSNLIDKIPNYSPVANGNLQLRRSDFNWAIGMKYLHNQDVVEIKLPLQHKRRLQDNHFIIDKNKLMADIHGLCFYRSLIYLLKRGNNDFARAERIYNENLSITIQKIKLNNLRSVRLIYSCIFIIENKKLWWYKNHQYRISLNDKIQELIFVLKKLKFEFGKRKFQAYIEDIEKIRFDIKGSLKKTIESMSNNFGA